MMHDTDTLTPTLPCPAWCELPAGHPYESFLDDGQMRRYHVRTVVENIPTIGHEDLGALVQLSSAEDVPEDGEARLAPVSVEVFGYEEGDRLTPGQARQVAAALVAAADECDRARS